MSRMLPAAVLVTGLVLFFALGLDRYFDFEMLQEHRNWLMGKVEELGLLAIGLYTLLYMTLTAFSIPLGGIMTIAAGFFFGTVVAASCAVIGGTLGRSSSSSPRGPPSANCCAPRRARRSSVWRRASGRMHSIIS